jgi:hypothetical protein
VRIMCVFLVNVSMNCWCLLEPSSEFTVTVWDNLVWGNTDFEECFVALRMIITNAKTLTSDRRFLLISDRQAAGH